MHKKIILSICAAFFFLTFVSGVKGDEKQAIIKGTIASDGRVEDTYPPDTVTIVLAVETMTRDASGSAEKNRVITGKVIDTLKKFTRREQDDSIQTLSYSVEPVHEYDQANKISIFKGYRVINRIGIKLKTIDTAGTVIDDALAAGANRIDSIQFSLSDDREYCSRLIAEASARAKADALAAAAPLATRLKGLKSADVSCSTESARPVYRKGMMMESALASTSSTPIEAGTIKLIAAVRAVFYIDDK